MPCRTCTFYSLSGHTRVADWERLGFSIAFTEVATNMNLSETEKGVVLAAFYYGYSITPV